MSIQSLRFRLSALWLLLLLSAGTTAFLLISFFQETASAQVDRAQERSEQACRSVAERYAFFSSGWSGPGADGLTPALRTQLGQVVETALSGETGFEGGVWQADAGSLAYAYPTYEGSGPKTDLPAAEFKTIERANLTANASRKSATVVKPGNSQVLVLQACPLPGPIAGLTGWTMTRVYTGTGEGYRRLLVGLAVLCVTVVGSALWLTWVLIAWSRRIGDIETALAGATDGVFPPLPLRGDRDFDRLLEALNASGARLRDAQKRIASAERLAAMGRLTAGVTHEIRNPIAAMRLKAENALASPDQDRRSSALRFMLDQIARLDQLLHDLLSMSQPRRPQREPVDLTSFMAQIEDQFRDLAAGADLSLRVRFVGDPPDAADPPSFDRDQIRRAIGNMLINAIQNSPAQGAVAGDFERQGDRLIVSVRDAGAGVPPDIADTLFEPFVTGRTDGTGLGLAIVREIARAHGGEVRHAPSPAGALFRLEVPWRA